MEIKLVRSALQDLQQNYLNRFDTVQPVDLMDLEEIGVRIKHLNVVSHAQGYLYLRKGLAVRAHDSKAAIRFFQQAIVKFEEVLHTNTYHKLTLRNCALCLLYLHDELKHLAAYVVAIGGGRAMVVVARSLTHSLSRCMQQTKDATSRRFDLHCARTEIPATCDQPRSRRSANALLGGPHVCQLQPSQGGRGALSSST